MGHEAQLRQYPLHVTAQPLAVRWTVTDGPHTTANGIDSVVWAEIGALARQPVDDARAALTDCAVGDTSCLTAADAWGDEIDEAEVVCWGRSPACAAARPETSDQKEKEGRDCHV